MHVYIDESGDTGFKFKLGSSRYFVIALLLVDDPIPLHQAVHEFRLHASRAEAYEFKFVHAPHELRHAFFRAIQPAATACAPSLSISSAFTEPNLRSKDRFYDYVVKLPLAQDESVIADAHLVIDESFKGKSRQADLTTRLQRELNMGTTKKIVSVAYHDSRRDNLLQVVDMVAGAIARTYEKEDGQYQRLFRRKIQDVRLFPPLDAQ